MPTADIRGQVRKAIEATPQRERILRVSLFGSFARGAEREGSDIDLLIEFTSPVGFFDLDRLQRELERSLLRPVDLVTPASLSPYCRAEVLGDAVPVYGS